MATAFATCVCPTAKTIRQTPGWLPLKDRSAVSIGGTRDETLRLGEDGWPSGSAQPQSVPAMPPAGPHDTPELTNPIATPGTGMLPPTGPHHDIDCISS